MNAADIIASCALLFTVASFWWLYARAGKLEIVGEPRSFSFAAPPGEFLLNLPLVFTNSRPLPAVAENLRLHFEAPGFPANVPFIATHDGVQPKNATRQMATSIVIQGRETRLICCEFISKPCDATILGPVNVRVTVEAFLKRRQRHLAWQSLLNFELRLSKEAAENRSRYLTYDNQEGIS